MAGLKSHGAVALRNQISSICRHLDVPRRFQSSLTKAPTADPPTTTVQPNYDIEPDRATSNFSPIPKRIQYGTEPGILPAAVLPGTPIELQARTVRIFQEAKPASQSGTWRGRIWRMEWDVLPKGHRWENQLMGWQSSADPMQGTHVNFKSKEDAVAFAEKQGYEYFIQEPNSRAFTPKAYADNFAYSATALKMIRTK